MYCSHYDYACLPMLYSAEGKGSSIIGDSIMANLGKGRAQLEDRKREKRFNTQYVRF